MNGKIKKPAPLLLMVERADDGSHDPGRPVVTLLRPMPGWLERLCRFWQKKDSGASCPAPDPDRLFDVSYSLETSPAVFNNLLWPELWPAPYDNQSETAAQTAVRLVLTPPRKLIVDARRHELEGVNTDV